MTETRNSEKLHLDANVRYEVVEVEQLKNMLYENRELCGMNEKLKAENERLRMENEELRGAERCSGRLLGLAYGQVAELKEKLHRAEIELARMNGLADFQRSEMEIVRKHPLRELVKAVFR